MSAAGENRPESGKPSGLEALNNQKFSFMKVALAATLWMGSPG